MSTDSQQEAINYNIYIDPRVGPPLIISVAGAPVQIGRPPSVKQWAFINRAEREQLYGGSKSGGKSRGICAKLITLAVEFPGNQLGLFRQDLTDLKGSTLVTFEKMLPKQLLIQHHKTDHYYVIRSKNPDYPSKMYYGGLGERDDFESAKGKEYGAFAIDEPSEIDMQVYLQMLGQLRWTLPDGSRPPYQAILGSNPEPGWLEDHFGHLISATDEQVPIATDGQRVYIMALPKDNPYLPRDWEQILLDTPNIPKSWIDKYLRGSWKASEGLVFKELDEIHFIPCPPAEFLRQLTFVASLDHASTGVVCFCVDGIDRFGNVFALGSYYGKNRLISQHSADIRALCDAWMTACGREEEVKARAKGSPHIHWSIFGFDYVLIDPSTQAKTLQSKTEMWSTQDQYAREGIPTQPAWNALESGVRLMEEYIHPKPQHLHPLTGKPEAPSFYIVREYNREGIREMESWKRTITVNKTIRYVGADHWIDNQRYIIMSRPEPPRFVGSQIGVTDVHARKMARAMEQFDRTFGKNPDESQWFAGGTGRGKLEGTWFPRPN